MTRKSKREIEREVDSISGTGEKETPGILIVQENVEAETVDLDGEPISEEKLEQAGLIIDMSLSEI